MTKTETGPTTALCRYTETEIFYREKNLVTELLSGNAGFVEVMAAHILGRTLPPAELRLLDAILITLMEHGMTPSAIAARSVYMSAPENLQGAVAAGLLAVGSRFVGTIENTAMLLAELVTLEPGERKARADRIVAEHRARKAPVPGFGHHLHRPDDPRAIRLIALGEAAGLDRGHLESLKILAAAVDAGAGRHITINATGAVAALLGEMEIPAELMRGFAVIARGAGLVAHIAEERERPSGMRIWRAADEAVPYAR